MKKSQNNSKVKIAPLNLMKHIQLKSIMGGDPAVKSRYE